MARLLIINADDLGLSQGVNEGILDAHAHGVVTSASLMVRRPAARAAAGEAKHHPELSVGLHFEEDEGADIDDPAQLGAAFAGQLERFRDLMGRDPTHVDSHHHVHLGSNERLQIFRQLVAPLGVPLRSDGQVAYVGAFYAQWEEGVSELERVRRPFLLRLIATEVRDGWTELACHPARITGDLHSTYVRERAVELETLTEPGLRKELEGSGVRLVSYLDWRSGELI